ncbi:hypothetical protein BJ742DRAFT_399884 [Cladochytrium replicatum]|nr:hypothetical protein BJ742DRAFT_399884 [Cladochytrium replicatum]
MVDPTSSDVQAAASSSQKYIHPYNPDDLPSNEINAIQDTDEMIMKALGHYPSLNEKIQELNHMDHAISEHAANLKELAERIAEKEHEIIRLESDLDKLNRKIEQIENGGLGKLVAMIKHGVKTTPGGKKETAEENLARTRDETAKSLSDLRTEINEIMEQTRAVSQDLKEIREDREEHLWARDELRQLLARIFDGPSPNYPYEDDLEDEVNENQAICDRISDDIRRYGQMPGLIARITANIDKGITSLRDAKRICQVAVENESSSDFARALGKYNAVLPIASSITILLAQGVDLLPGLLPCLNEFGQYPTATELGFGSTTSRTADFRALIRHVGECILHFRVLKYQLARIAAQMPERIDEAKKRLEIEKRVSEASRTRLFALRRQIMDRAWWESVGELGVPETSTVLSYRLRVPGAVRYLESGNGSVSSSGQTVASVQGNQATIEPPCYSVDLANESLASSCSAETAESSPPPSYEALVAICRGDGDEGSYPSSSSTTGSHAHTEPPPSYESLAHP